MRWICGVWGRPLSWERRQSCWPVSKQRGLGTPLSSLLTQKYVQQPARRCSLAGPGRGIRMRLIKVCSGLPSFLLWIIH